MTKKASPSGMHASGHESVKICFERIIPDNMDPERSVRRALREHMVASATHKLNADELAHLARMAVVNSKKWQPGTILKCHFLDGSPKMRKKTQAIAHQWERYCDIKFKFVTAGTPEIRISFYADSGSWSAVGRDALNQQYFPPHQPTMN